MDETNLIKKTILSLGSDRSRFEGLKKNQEKLSSQDIEELLNTFSKTHMAYDAYLLAKKHKMTDIAKNLLESEPYTIPSSEKYRRAHNEGDEEERKRVFPSALNELERKIRGDEYSNGTNTYGSAARLCEQEAELTGDKKYLVRAVKDWSESEDYSHAAELSLKLGNLEDAASFFEKDYKYQKAAKIREELGQLELAAKDYLKKGPFQPFYDVKDIEKGIDLLWKSGQYIKAIKQAVKFAGRSDGYASSEFYSTAYLWAANLKADPVKNTLLRWNTNPNHIKKKAVRNLKKEYDKRIVAGFLEKIQDYSSAVKYHEKSFDYEAAGDAALKIPDESLAKKFYEREFKSLVNFENYAHAAKLAKKAGFEELEQECINKAKVLGQNLKNW